MNPRIHPVEDNPASLFRRLLALPRYTALPDSDVLAFTSDVPHPLLNHVSQARFRRGQEERRAREVLEHFFDHGLPFMWQVTPSSRFEGLEELLRTEGLEEETQPGMYAELSPPHSGEAAGVALEAVTPATMVIATEVMARGFDFPDFLLDPLLEAFEGLDGPHLTHVLARLDEEPVGFGTGHLDGTTLGIYNVATVPETRGRGVGTAVTAALMDIGAARGCDHAVLHATQMGVGVYERLGFEEVCPVSVFVATPDTPVRTDV